MERSDRCPRHTEYTGKIKPRASCIMCWGVYFKRNPKLPILGEDAQAVVALLMDWCLMAAGATLERFLESIRAGAQEAKADAAKPKLWSPGDAP